MNSLFFDLLEMDDLYQKLMSVGDSKVRQQVISAMENGMTKGLESLQNARQVYFESVRYLLLFLQCPIFSNDKDLDMTFDARGDLIMSICEAMLSLPFEGYKALINWAISVYGKKHFFVSFLVRPLVAQLNTHLSNPNAALIVSVLKWLQNASLENGLAKSTDFHSTAIGELPMETLYEDLARFKSSRKPLAGRKPSSDGQGGTAVWGTI